MNGPHLPGWTLHRRTARGWELTTVELVPDGTAPDQLTDQPGRLSPAAVAVLIESWDTRRTSAHDMMLQQARGQLPVPTVKVRSWRAWHVRNGRLNGRMSGQWDDLPTAARAAARAATHRRR